MAASLAATAGALVPDVRKIGVLRANALGDFVFALPALAALRIAYPDAEIVLIAREWHEDFLAGRPGPVDRVVALRHGALGDETEVADFDPRERERTLAAMRTEQFDLVLQMHGGGRHSNPFARELGGRLTAGLQSADAPPLDRSVPYVYLQSEVMRLREVAAIVGAVEGPLEPRLAVTEPDLDESLRAMPGDGRPIAILHPGASDTRRRWPVRSFAAVGDALAAAGCAVAVTGDTKERDLVGELVESLSDGRVTNLAGKLGLRGLTGLLSRAAVVVSNDTGPLHVARAVGTPTVGIYVAVNVINSGPSTRTRHRLAVSWRTECLVCGMQNVDVRCEHQESFVADVSVETVRDAALELLRAQATPPA